LGALHKSTRQWSWLGLCSVLALAGLPLIRLVLSVGFGFPAPAGDSILFASVAQYHCASGKFETPIFPLDPTGAMRYVWHGIGQSALLSWLNPDCSVRGGYVALSLLLLATSLLILRLLVPTRGWWVGMAVALVVFALQSKQGFRPEVSAMLLVLVCEWLRHRGSALGCVAAAGLLPWFHPTAFLLYAGWWLLTTSRAELSALLRQAGRVVAVAAAVQLSLWAVYPFPLADLLHGLSLQGRTFAQRTDGDVFTYWIRSDFFPLFGLAFAWAYTICVVRKPALLLMLPLWWFYGFRVPPAYYNLVPLFGAMLLWLWWPGTPSTVRWYPQARSALLVLCVLLAGAGLAQSVVRDGVSLVRYGSTLEAAAGQLTVVQASGQVPCRVPRWITLMEEAKAFEASQQPTLKRCDSAEATTRVDLVPPLELRQRPDRSLCKPWPQDQPMPVLGRLFQSDSGYGFLICPTAAP
jgi:hypothetical protein